MSSPRKDAEGQFAKSQGDRKGVQSAKPTVVTGSEDATVHRTPRREESQRQGCQLRSGGDERRQVELIAPVLLINHSLPL